MWFPRLRALSLLRACRVGLLGGARGRGGASPGAVFGTAAPSRLRSQMPRSHRMRVRYRRRASPVSSRLIRPDADASGLAAAADPGARRANLPGCAARVLHGCEVWYRYSAARWCARPTAGRHRATGASSRSLARLWRERRMRWFRAPHSRSCSSTTPRTTRIKGSRGFLYPARAGDRARDPVSSSKLDRT